MYPLDDCLAFIMSNSAREFGSALERRMRNCEVNRNQWMAMHYIYSSGSLSQVDLAAQMRVTEPSIARMVQILEQRGYLERGDVVGDKRRKTVSLTEEGKRVYLEMLPIAEKFKDDCVAGVDEKTLEEIKVALAKMVENARKM